MSVDLSLQLYFGSIDLCFLAIMRIAKHLGTLFILHVRIGHVHLFHHRLNLSVFVVEMGDCIRLLVLHELFNVLSFPKRSEFLA